MNREQKQLYRLIGLTVSVLITIHLINYQASNQLLLTNTHPAARLAARSTAASSETQHEPSSLIDYSRIYYSQPTRNRKALVILFLVLWLSFLFSFVGIVASDFFCPNLSTISFRLGLSENLAGVSKFNSIHKIHQKKKKKRRL
jgi:sodium/potassium/calcium exchanger 6